jgi:MORN repeat variant
MQVQKSYHDNGKLAAEGTFKDGLPHGVVRRWHTNGVLAEEATFDNGIMDGTVTQWNDKGELLASYNLTKGTGTYRVWYPSGQLMGEIPMIDGKHVGHQRVYFEDGEIAADTYWLDNVKVSRKRYFEAARKDPRLPHYDDPSTPARIPGVSRREPSRRTTGETPDHLATTLLQGPGVSEALSWLTETTKPSRSLGEARGQKASTGLVRKLYSLGAIGVHAVDIQGGNNQEQNSGRLVIELPKEPENRKKLLKFCGQLAREAGFDPDPEMGQRYVFLMLD